MLLSVILEDEESLLHMSDEERKVELMRRSNACMYVEEAIVRLGELSCLRVYFVPKHGIVLIFILIGLYSGLDKVKGTNHFFYKVGAIDHG
jgi:hypothetical protein